MATRICLFAGIGILLVAFGSSSRQTIFAPGPLSRPHAQILSAQAQNDRCAVCHPVAGSAFAQWFGAGRAGHLNVRQTDLCMDCHHAVMDRDLARQPHNLEHEALVTIGRRIEITRGVPSRGNTAPLECAACHREHHGEDFDLTHLTNQQCQSCHSNTFHSFADGHPDWTQWPYGHYGQEANIAFDHGSHEFEHHPKQGHAFDCRTCHSIDSQGVIARAGSYQSMCANCHDESLKVRTNEGFALLGLPTLDGEAITEVGLELAPWPLAANGIDRFQIPVLTKILLSRNAETAAAIKRLEDPTLNSMDTIPDEETIRAMKLMADQLRTLHDQLSQRPDQLLAQSIDPQQGPAVLGQLSRQLLITAGQAWFADAPSQTIGGNATAFDPAADLPRGGWYRDDWTSSIRYRGAGHADPVLQALVELTGSNRLDPIWRQQLRELPVVASCIECHPGGPDAAWRATVGIPGERRFTKFSHQPHLNLPRLNDCRYCHTPKRSEEANEVNLVHANSANHVHDFEPLGKAACVSCHTPEAAGDSCLKCHNYHIKSL